MPKYVKKPIVIDAWQWLPGDLFAAGRLASQLRMDNVDFQVTKGSIKCLLIKTLEGNMLADPGDFIIKGIAGEYYPCKPDIFYATYDPYPDT